MSRLRVDHPAQLCATDQAQRLRMQNPLLALREPIRYDTEVWNPEFTVIQENARVFTGVRPARQRLCPGVGSQHQERLCGHLSHRLRSAYVDPVACQSLPMQVLFSKPTGNVSLLGEQPRQGQAAVAKVKWTGRPTYIGRSQQPRAEPGAPAERCAVPCDLHARVKPGAKQSLRCLSTRAWQGQGSPLLRRVQLRAGSWLEGPLSARELAQCLLAQQVRVPTRVQARLCPAQHERLGPGARGAESIRRQPS